MEDKDFESFVESVKRLTAIDLNLYKETQMKRRLTTFRSKKGFPTFDAFYREMAKDPSLLAEFLDRMTINVSEFWRNANRWEVAEKTYLPQMLKNNRSLKCWSAACSTGEEPYTMAMILDRLGALGDAKLLATDLDEGVLARAKQGVYQERSLREVPSSYRDTYFIKETGTYRVADRLKQAVMFRRQNLLNDPFDSQFDWIVCRNVMIYFTDEAKQVLYTKFAQALKPGGILFVGSTEQIFSPGRYGFEPADTFFYRKL
ncbi:chemotaxis protein methyltransferase [Paenibacillus sp. J31TS4]|uniref:CheR family methyltransferase n=1 Tax=Paenibacillus sp. J31TS4 TaxID=2807195 RepID=UPI001B2DBAF5|nr:protein-glutamate O-methyltransferase CheR [Paenibacillus sp. J31TS4]GIP37468.1 chemotaxis protein methyltransferase [Paenibacillus sp. J31TS4]